MSEPEWNFDEKCPHCGYQLRDIYEHFFSGDEEASTECPSCEKPIMILKRISYVIKPLPEPPKEEGK